jgi:squalene-hopene/tetraprenyl-beta-curcumene cyclase
VNVDQRLEEALDNARHALQSRRGVTHWEGRLSTSALATSTAIVALAQDADRGSGESGARRALVGRGLEWLARHQNEDGGWGDTPASPSNISTTALGWAACHVDPTSDESTRAAAAQSEAWLDRQVGGLTPAALAAAIVARYGKDRTFSAPILLVCALTGRLGPDGWRFVPQLPFELAALPRQWFARLRLPVVSYALPALIAIGLARHHRRPSRHPLARAARRVVTPRTLDVLRLVQPPSGGFLEAAPLTAFVVMSLAAGGRIDHPVANEGLAYLARSVRADGSWPIDANLATWVTTLAINALGADLARTLTAAERESTRDWLLAQQYRVIHPYTLAAPGGWAWTDLPGGVPDADDTSGALIALRSLGPVDDRVRTAATAGLKWLLALQNGDGGIPTFCRGWTNLPFDRSGPDLTAHALRAWCAWSSDCPALTPAIDRATDRALRYLEASARRDGAWTPLWFGNQWAPEDENPTYGTARVLLALRDLSGPRAARLAASAARWLGAGQNEDGGWGGAAGTPSTIEETALAVQALAGGAPSKAVDRGVEWLIDATDRGRRFPPSPIGLYFARLWYSEDLYPLVFTIGALERARRQRARRVDRPDRERVS